LPQKFFEILRTDEASQARLGRLNTTHGSVDTPVFMPVGSQGSVKGLTPRDLHQVGARMILGNAYHLYLRPGHELVRQAGGLHRFMGWDGAMLTDSGGFQVFSLSDLCRIRDDGVEFRSHIDGSLHFLTPERMVEVQEALGADVMMALDDCPGLPAPPERVRIAVRRTIDWAGRCLQARRRTDQALFGIVQGGLDPALRRECLDALLRMPFPGYAIGGLSVGEDREATAKTAASVAAELPAGSPRYLMGVGRPEELVELVGLGIDMFDCVLPTRNGRNGSLFTSVGTLNIKRTEFRADQAPIEAGCPCYTCTHFSRSYLRHLYKSSELLSYQLFSIHNLMYYLRLMEGIRSSLKSSQFNDFREKFRRGGLAGALKTDSGSS
jgi:queuine tRNA-ribosyltransferase